MQLTAEQITIFLFTLTTMLLAAKLFSEIFIKLNQPAVIGEILAGIILGPTVLGMISPDTFELLFSQKEVSLSLDSLITLSVIFLLLVSGLEVDLSVIFKNSKSVTAISSLGIIFPFVIGFGVSYFFPTLMGKEQTGDHLAFSLFMGTALSISALPVIAKTLIDLNILKTKIGLLIISSAMINDFLGWLLFSLILGLIGAGLHGINFVYTLIFTLLFVIFMLLIGRKIVDFLLQKVNNKLSFPGSSLSFILILGLLGASFTELIGIHAVFGAFIVGVAFGDSVHLKEETKVVLHQFITNIFAPLFFVSIGLKVNFIANFDFVLVIIVLVLAFIGKVVGCSLGAYWSGMEKNDAFAIGFGMNSRGAMEIILALLGLQFGLIKETVFVALVVMALVTSLVSAPFMNYFIKEKRKLKFINLLSKNRILFSNNSNKEDSILELVELASKELIINKDEIVKLIIARENSFPTGIANHLAIPHAKINIDEPFIALSINKNGIDFGAEDGLPAKIIVLLLTPEKSNELQLQLLSEIAHSFASISNSIEIASSYSQEEIINKIKIFSNTKASHTSGSS
jgi:Kef-type K+ transport system membrane component KefB/mannitol/fructose-specific phosphotransferase system IIA component